MPEQQSEPPQRFLYQHQSQSSEYASFPGWFFFLQQVRIVYSLEVRNISLLFAFLSHNQGIKMYTILAFG